MVFSSLQYNIIIIVIIININSLHDQLCLSVRKLLLNVLPLHSMEPIPDFRQERLNIEMIDSLYTRVSTLV